MSHTFWSCSEVSLAARIALYNSATMNFTNVIYRRMWTFSCINVHHQRRSRLCHSFKNPNVNNDRECRSPVVLCWQGKHIRSFADSKSRVSLKYIEYEVRCSRMVSNQMASTKVQLFSSNWVSSARSTLNITGDRAIVPSPAELRTQPARRIPVRALSYSYH